MGEVGKERWVGVREKGKGGGRAKWEVGLRAKEREEHREERD